jgi:hypothetical protein
MTTDAAPPRRRLRAAALGAGWLAATAGVAAGAWLAVSAAGDGLGMGQRVLTADQVRARLADVDGTGDGSGAAATTPPVAVRPTTQPTTDDRPGGGQDEPAQTSPAGPGGSTSGGSTSGGSTSGGSTSGGSTSGGSTSGGATSTQRPPAAPVRTSAVATSGGTAAVACQGGVVSLRYATPRDGWTVAVEDRGPDTVKVVFARPTGDGSGDHGSGGSGEDHGGGHGPEATAKATCVGGAPVWETEQH